MNFEEWMESIKDKWQSLEDAWIAGQENYPFAICDKSMQDKMISDLKTVYKFTDDEAEQFVGTLGSYIIDDIWGTYDTSMAEYVQEFLG